MYYKRAILMVALLFLSVSLIFGLGARSDVAFAKSRGVTRGPIECNNLPDNDLIKCCQTETDSKGVEITYCTVCDNTAPPSDCGPRKQVSEIKLPPSDLPTVEQTPTVSQPKVLSGKNLSSLSTGTIKEQPSTTLQPKTTLCPDGSAPDSKGNCPTAENKIPPPPPSSDNLQLKGGSESKSNSDDDDDDNNNNNPNSDHNQKGNDLGKIEGGSVTKNSDAGSDSN